MHFSSSTLTLLTRANAQPRWMRSSNLNENSKTTSTFSEFIVEHSLIECCSAIASKMSTMHAWRKHMSSTDAVCHRNTSDLQRLSP